MISFTPRRLNPGESVHRTHWIEDRVDPRAGLDPVEKRKFLTLSGLELRPFVVQPVASLYTDCTISAHAFSSKAVTTGRLSERV
jgi:hypothetical protein